MEEERNEVFFMALHFGAFFASSLTSVTSCSPKSCSLEVPPVTPAPHRPAKENLLLLMHVASFSQQMVKNKTKQKHFMLNHGKKTKQT